MVASSKRKTETPLANSELVIEYLDDADLEAIEPEPTDIDQIYDTLPSSPRSTIRTPTEHRPRLGSGRFSIDPDAEEHVVNEWLTSIAAAASDARSSDPVVTAADIGPAFPLMAPPPPRRSPSRSASRLPAVSAPPLLPNGMPYEPSDIVDTLPAPRKRASSIRTSTPFVRTMPHVSEGTSETSPPPPPVVSSIGPSLPPLAMGVAPARIRPRLSWIVAAAAVGVLVAVTVIWLADAKQEVASDAPPSPPSVAVATAPAAVTPTVVQFSDDEGIVIDVPATAATSPVAAAPPATAPVTSARPRPHKPKRAETESKVPPPPPIVSVAPVVEPPPSSVAPPPPPRVRKLTPEQELAEAQLRAATR